MPPIPACGAFRIPIWRFPTLGLIPIRGSIPLWHSIVVNPTPVGLGSDGPPPGQRHQLPRLYKGYDAVQQSHWILLSRMASDEFEQSMAEHAETRDRTGDLQIFSLALSQLSYRG